MNDPDKLDLLNDLLGDETARSESLRRMLAEGKRAKRRTLISRVALVAAIGVAATVGIWPHQPAKQQASVPTNDPPPITIRPIRADELKDRLRYYAVAYVGNPGAQRIVLLEEIPQ